MKGLLSCCIVFLIVYVLYNLAEVDIAFSVPEILIDNSSLKIETVFSGLDHPVMMTFIGQNDILVTEKEKGTVHRIVNGTAYSEPLLDVAVANGVERGLLGIASKNSTNGKTFVFVYYVKSGGGEDGDDVRKNVTANGSILERYELNNNKLVNPKTLLLINSKPNPPLEDGKQHVGGKIAVGPDGNIYLQVGDGMNQHTLAQNYHNGSLPNGTGGILRVTEDGFPVDPPIDNVSSMKYYYSYGMRNGIGMDFDPLTGLLWNTEVGSTFGDEINLVLPGFNSGWSSIQGIRNYSKPENQSPFNHILVENMNPSKLVNFTDKGVYRDPEFSWKYPVTPTAMKFLNSNKLGSKLENDLFVAQYTGGRNATNIYHFELDRGRESLNLNNSLSDKIADSPNEVKDIIFATGFETITDMQVGKDGYLYILTFRFSPAGGTIYRITPISENIPDRISEAKIGKDNVESNWTALGGKIASHLVLANNSDGRLELFGIGPDHSLMHTSQISPGNSSAWSGWQSLGGYLIDDPVISQNSDGRLEVFVRGRDNMTFHKWQTVRAGNNWSDYQSLESSLLSEPVATKNQDGRLELFGIGPDHSLMHTSQISPGNSSAWSGWQSLGGYLIDDPVISQNSDGGLGVFVRGINNSTFYESIE